MSRGGQLRKTHAFRQKGFSVSGLVLQLSSKTEQMLFLTFEDNYRWTTPFPLLLVGQIFFSCDNFKKDLLVVGLCKDLLVIYFI